MREPDLWILPVGGATQLKPEFTPPATATILEKVMSKYTAEQVEEMSTAAAISLFPLASVMLRDYATLLRERESAKGPVTDEVIQLAIVTAEKYSNATQIGWDTMRAALEAVAPMLVPKQNSPSEDFIQNVPDKCDRIIWRKKYYSLPMLASARVPDYEWLELADVLDKFTPTGGPGPLWGAGASFAYSDAAKTIRAKLAAAPKPETEE